MIRFAADAASIPGTQRTAKGKTNQDRYTVLGERALSHMPYPPSHMVKVFPEDAYAIAVLADGHGPHGEWFAERAVTLAVTRCMGLFAFDTYRADDVRNLLQEVNAALIEERARKWRDEDIRTGSTLDVLLLTQEQYCIGHVGDARVYRHVEERLLPCTTDQVGYLLVGVPEQVSYEEALLHHNDRGSPNALGRYPELTSEVHIGAVQGTDAWIMVTDGVYGAVHKDEMLRHVSAVDAAKRIVEQTEHPEQVVELLYSRGVSRRRTRAARAGQDNATCLVIRQEDVS